MYDIKAAAVNRLAPSAAFGVHAQPIRGGQSPTQKVHTMYMTDPSSHDEVSQLVVEFFLANSGS